MTEKTIEEKVREKEPDSIDISVEGFGPWSISKLGVAEKCPLKFYLQYLVKLKVGTPVYNLITDVGKAAHRVLEFIVMGKSVGDSLKLTRREFEHMPDQVWKDNMLTLEYNINEFRDKIESFGKQHPVKRFVQELRIGFTRDYQPTGFFADDVFFRGILDLGIQMETKDVVIIDHKTGAPSLLGIRNFKTQLDTYKILFNFGVEEVDGAQSGIHFVRDGKILLDDYVSKADITGKLVRELEHNLSGAIDRIKELGHFKHVRGNHCKYCDYNVDCKAGKFETIEKESAKYFPIKQA